MVSVTENKVFLDAAGVRHSADAADYSAAKKNTMAWRILQAHNYGSEDSPELKFDALVSPDNNYVSILQTARAVGLKHFPVPYVLTNCHNSLCAVGGTVNEDDHVFGMDNAEKCGGIFVPPYRAVLHQYMRETMAGCGRMILGSDSHTRYGALGTMGIGEGGGEVVRQLMGELYQLPYPEIVAVVLEGKPKPGVGPCDVALAMIGKVFSDGTVRNKVLEIFGPGVEALDMDYRMGIDVMTTESGALSSIWCTDEKTHAWLSKHGRADGYYPLSPEGIAAYDAEIRIDLSSVPCMLALPFHPSHAVSVVDFRENAERYMREIEEEGMRIKKSGSPFRLMHQLRDGELYIEQALISGCAGGIFGNITAAADILRGHSASQGRCSLGIHPASQPVMMELMRNSVAQDLLLSGATIRPAMCGSCFGVMDIPSDNSLSIRHVTRNYANREGSKTGQNQMAATIIMDARSIAATMRNGGRLTGADELDIEYRDYDYHYESEIYASQVHDWRNTSNPERELRMGPNIAPWPEIPRTDQHLLLQCAGVYEGSVTTDDLVPSGEATSYRSNPEKLSAFTLSARDSAYVARAKDIRAMRDGTGASVPEEILALASANGCEVPGLLVGSVIASDKIGDGSSREQAVSNQRVLGGAANLSHEYSTKRYRSNCINWGLLPLRTEDNMEISTGDWLLIENVHDRIDAAGEWFTVKNLSKNKELSVTLDSMSAKEKRILHEGCLINYYKSLQDK